MRARERLRAGQWVEIRSKEEILATLDNRGQLDALPFMPEMFQYCGRRFQVFKRAHKTCDPPSGLQARRMADAVHLEGIRCDGAAHGGCQAGCLIFWKDAWLKKVAPGPTQAPTRASARAVPGPPCGEGDVHAAVHPDGWPAGAAEPTYVCQSTRLASATTPLPWWDPRQYLEDLLSGNVRLREMVAAALFVVYHGIAEAGLGLGSPMRWAYDFVQTMRGRAPYPLRPGQVPRGARTPSATLNLQPGDTVRVRSYPEILRTLDEGWHNRGMYFDGEQVPFCRGTYRVLRRVEKIIDEKTGLLIRLKSDALVLSDVACQARYAKGRLFCSRSIYPYWREVWLERTRDAGSGRPPPPPSC